MKFLSIILAASSLAAAASSAVAQQQPAGAPGTTAAPSEEIIITGTRRTDRTVTESSAPIDVLSGADLASQSTANMLDTLSNMVPSFIVGQNSISDASSFVRSPSLRGLPADEMLVMLNGKRMNRSALVQVFQGGETELAFGSQGPDLASIPSIAVKSLEILRDGASAQYGSDAIAGVLNYQFRDNSSGIEFSARYGEYSPGHGYSHDGDDKQIAANVGLPLGGQGFVNISLEWAKNGQTVRNAQRPGAFLFGLDVPSLASQMPHYPGPVQQWGTGPSDGVKALVNAGLKLDNGDQVYFFANYANIEQNESFNYRQSKPETDSLGNTFPKRGLYNDIYLDACKLPPAMTGCPAGGFILDSNIFNFTSFYPAGFTPRFYGITQQFFGAVGYKGTTSGGLSYDVSGTTAQNSLGVSLRDTINPSLGPLSPRTFYNGKFVQKEANFNLDVSYPWTVAGLASPLYVAGGLEWRDETYQQLLGDPGSFATGRYAFQPLYSCTGTNCTPALDNTGTQRVATTPTESNGYGGISTPVDAGQVSYAGYVDFEADVLKNLTLGIAGRYEDYASYGSTTLGKFQARFKATDWLALRGTASTGFHAPTPGQSNVQTVSTTFAPGTAATQLQIGTYPVTSPIAMFYGATALKPEESTNLSAGIVLTPAPDLLLTLDGYNIKVRHRIGITSPTFVRQVDIDQLPDLANVGVGGIVQYFTNGFSTTTKGVDLVATYLFHAGPGTLATTLAYNYNKSDVSSVVCRVPTDPTTCVISAARIVDIQHYAPNNRANLNLDYRVARFIASVHENYYGSFRDDQDYAGQLFGSKLTTDLDLSYEVVKNVTAAIGGRNIFNAYPDKVASSAANTVYPYTGGLTDGEVYPRTGGPFGYNGAFFYVRVAAKF